MALRKVLVTGNFDVLHPGHIRLLNFAKECGDYLIVAVNSDAAANHTLRVKEHHRLEIVKALECVNEAFIFNESLEKLISSYKPYAIVKGKEFEQQANPEKLLLSSYGGKLIFGSGDFELSSTEYIKATNFIGSSFDFKGLQSYICRNQITLDKLHSVIHSFSNLNIAVIGEAIVDQYISGKAVGLSQEDPTIVMTPSSDRKYLGGAAITAAHFKSLGANSVQFISVVGCDANADFVKQHTNDYEIDAHIFYDQSRPTPLKTRYRADNKTLLRVNTLRHHHISLELQQELLAKIESLVDGLDVLVFSDFNYGLLPDNLVNQITNLCRNHHVKLVADSQSSSQVGDISRYQNMLLITPTEKECRLAVSDFNSGLVTLAQVLCQKCSPGHLVITQGSEGCFIHTPTQEGQWSNDQLPAINKNAVDPAGAGDCFLAVSTLALMSGATPQLAFFLATLAAGCQVDRVGNIPLKKDVLISLLSECFR